jgi:ElaB/YqjD/DUF883 family membrane-anchored ribosome-binding protein
MKLSNQAVDTASKLTQSVKARAAKAGKALRKSTSAAKKTTRTAAKRTLRQQQAALSGYSDTASRFIGRAKSAFGDAYTWVGETGNALPKTAKRMGLPNQQSMQEFIDEKPLIVGAVGLGLGIALGAMLPMTRATAPARRSARKSSRRN